MLDRVRETRERLRDRRANSSELTRIVLQEFDEIDTGIGATRNANDEIEEEQGADEQLSVAAQNGKFIT